jgi:hypothetical protein
MTPLHECIVIEIAPGDARSAIGSGTVKRSIAALCAPFELNCAQFI